MSIAAVTDKVAGLRRAVRSVDGPVYLVEPRVIRRILRELHGYARLSARIPHTDVQVVRDSDIRALAHSDELGLESFDGLAEWSVLVAQPEEHELEKQTLPQLTQTTWSRIFHGMVDLKLKRVLAGWPSARSAIQQRIDRLGQVEFDEAHAVLISELRLIDPDSYVESYLEFHATWLQLHHFNPDLISVWFPSLANSKSVLTLLREDLDDEAIFESTRPDGAEMPDLQPEDERDEVQVAKDRLDWTHGQSTTPSAARYTRQMRKRSRWGERGNTVAAGVAAVRAMHSATTPGDRAAAAAAAREETSVLADRLQAALRFDASELDDWRESLWELVQNSTQGFWNSDKRLLYDLQKVCLDHERIIYEVDLVKWIASRGKRRLRRPLRNVREVMMAKHLASSATRLPYVRLSGPERSQLARLLHDAAHLAEQQMRTRMRSTVHETIMDVGLNPGSIPEKVAFDKMVEESLDCITERGYLTMGYLRDAISRNDLKLPDLTDPRDLVRGDHLLRADDRLDVSLDGVYRRGEFYLRGLQVISSLAFGTRPGRFATLFLALPFGGALVIVVSMHHLLGVITGSHTHGEKDTPLPETESPPELTPENIELASDTLNSEDGTTTAFSDASENADTTAATALPIADASTAIEELVPGTADEATADPADSLSAVNAPTVTEVTISQPGDVEVSDSDTTETPTSTAESEEAVEEAVAEVIVVPPKEPNAVYQWVGDQTLPLTFAVGLLLMALIHLPAFRGVFYLVMRRVWRCVRWLIYDVPVAILNFPPIRELWRQRWFVRLRRYAGNPLLFSFTLCRLVPYLLHSEPHSWLLVAAVAALTSLAINSRLGRDAEELTAEWLANAWYDLRSRFLMALLDWVIDFFKWLLNLLERFIYAVDEWLRFHSGETWATIVVKAVLGVIWSFVSFLIRIYVNLLIEPTLHPVKHFPVVTVAHKLFLPWILQLGYHMTQFFTPYLGQALAGAFTGFSILFLPGIFGFLVWELKENWRLYASNRIPALRPVVIGSHGENGGRLVRPGFHSGTLPKLFRRLRRLERRPPSFKRFSERRALREALEHTEREIRWFIERDLLRLLSYCSVWNEHPVRCESVKAASNSFLVRLSCDSISSEPLTLLFQEQSGWIVATVPHQGWLMTAGSDRQCSFETALSGLYRKAGVELVREQMERNLLGRHPYDICSAGLHVWPDRQFEKQITIDLNRRHQLRPIPQHMASGYGLIPVSRDALVFSASDTLWIDWQRVWEPPENSEAGTPLPLACLPSAQMSLIGSGRKN